MSDWNERLKRAWDADPKVGDDVADGTLGWVHDQQERCGGSLSQALRTPVRALESSHDSAKRKHSRAQARRHLHDHYRRDGW
jgi:hypothetical protein